MVSLGAYLRTGFTAANVRKRFSRVHNGRFLMGAAMKGVVTCHAKH